MGGVAAYIFACVPVSLGVVQAEGSLMRCMFVLDGIAGEHCCTTRVQLADVHAFVPQPTDAELMARRKQLESHNDRRPHLLVADISYGAEVVPIPVFNSVNNVPVPVFEYSLRYSVPPSVSAMIAAVGGEVEACGVAAANEMHRKDRAAGAQATTPMLPYFSDGRLHFIEPYGVVECSDSCDTPECRMTRVVSRGVRVPLEVFMTDSGEGYGVRCAADIAKGVFVAAYVGKLCDTVAAEAAEHVEKDHYMWGLDHFQLQHRHGKAARLHKVRLPLTEMILCVDAMGTGNVARFINHSCDGGNLICQTVFTADARSTFAHYIGLFASRDISAMEELRIDYHYPMATAEDEAAGARIIVCRCGTIKCRGPMVIGKTAYDAMT